jgi:hypothetical protein
MATKEQIKKAILDVAGNPVSGVVADLADAWAEAVYALDNPTQLKAAVPSAEKRVVEPQETR